MKTINLFGFLTLIVFLIGCAPANNQKKARITRGGTAQHNLTQTPQGQSPVNKDNTGEAGTWGEITRGYQSQQQFQYQVQNFVSNLKEADGSPIALGSISGDSGQTTGIRFWGSVGLTGPFQVNGGNNLQVTSQGSALRISIVDSYVGQQNAEGETITEIPIYIASGVEGFVSVTGVVQGNTAQITYTDGFGTITLHGSFNSNWFYGTVSFRNNSPAVQGSLGTFIVQTCGFFKCN